MRDSLFIFFLLTLLLSCNRDKVKSDDDLTENISKDETLFDVELSYSDSAIIQVRIISPMLIRKKENGELLEEFPKGLHVEFLNKNGTVSSYLDAKYAMRYERKGIVIAEDSVVVYNRLNEKLETSQLTWDEANENLETPRFVKITRPEKGDTIYGFGLTADQEFNRFELKEVSGKSKFDNLVNSVK
jgi:LPS export ABC transporter protein LptC